jgi:outer membrane protein, multidrug efflux system
LIANVAGDLIAPLINKKAIKAEYLSANARQLQTVYNYQRVILNAFTEVTNRLSKVENYRKSIEIKKQQLESLVASVEAASRLFQSARAEYMDVLFAQRDLMDARTVLVGTKQQQLSAIVNTYQALGAGFTHHNRVFWKSGRTLRLRLVQYSRVGVKDGQFDFLG